MDPLALPSSSSRLYMGASDAWCTRAPGRPHSLQALGDFENATLHALALNALEDGLRRHRRLPESVGYPIA